MLLSLCGFMYTDSMLAERRQRSESDVEKLLVCCIGQSPSSHRSMWTCVSTELCNCKWTGIICAPFHWKSPEDHFEWKWIFILLVNIRTGAVLPPCAKWSIQSLPPDQVSQRNILLVMMLNRVSLCVSRGPDGSPVQGCRRCLFIESIRSDWGALPILCYTRYRRAENPAFVF